MFKKPKNNNEPTDVDEPQGDIQSAVTFYVQSDGTIFLDINLSDYSEETIDNFSHMMCSLGSEEFQLQALDIVQNGMIKDNKMDEFERFLTVMAQNTPLVHKAKKTRQKTEDDPCIKPSDMI